MAPWALVILTGCGWSPMRSDTLEAQNRRLGEQSKAQLAEIENLRVHARTVEDQLLQAEQDLAVFSEQYGVDRQQLANLRRERERLGDYLNSAGGMPTGVSGRLAELAERYPHLHFDSQTGISKLDTDVLFDSGEAALEPAAEQMLREFAQVLQSAEAENLKVMVVGHTDNQRIKGSENRRRFSSNWHLSTARALAVADVLRELGIDGERLGIAGFGPHQPIAANTAEPTRQRNRRVEIFVTSPATPIVGMTETLTNLY